MEILIRASQFILSLSLLIVLHELGHFIPAKLFKTRVEKFYLFFDYKFSILKKKVGETVYGIGWIPLGGYVKIAGMIDESMDKEQLKQPIQPWEFRAKPAWQRLIIMLGGVFVNFVLGIFIYIMLMWAYGEQFLPNENVKDGVWVQDSLAVNLGLQTGDKILSVDGESVKQFSSLSLEFVNGDKYQIERNGQIIDKKIPTNFISQLMDRGKDAGPFLYPRYPFTIGKISDDSPNVDSKLKVKDILTSVNGESIKYYDEAKTILGKYKGQKVSATVLRGKETKNIDLQITEKGTLGVVFTTVTFKNLEKLGYYQLANNKYSFGEAIPAGLNKAWETLTNYVKQLKKIFNPSTGAYKGLGGFKAIMDIFPNTWSWQAFWEITALLSIMLGFMNLLPIPALDGGHVVFTLWEMITGKKPGDKFLEYAQVTGFIILVALLLFANGNDLYRWIKTL
ncbi:RIP metalloprotease RseP [Polaribacter porphyrae]|uniref:Zinc metalloprotease n=1 Tax=Polaribacter porphyrae TaxID=1137780 RepID=A0A2S7WSY2_9FLAO|nr:RIP metalloprotease RseP [Polaribacter porphyrae]PQJ80707.1 RIP metalloprotease RseP [Polaribacter porphyrae]